MLPFSVKQQSVPAYIFQLLKHRHIIATPILISVHRVE